MTVPPGREQNGERVRQRQCCSTDLGVMRSSRSPTFRLARFHKRPLKRLGDRAADSVRIPAIDAARVDVQLVSRWPISGGMALDQRALALVGADIAWPSAESASNALRKAHRQLPFQAGLAPSPAPSPACAGRAPACARPWPASLPSASAPPSPARSNTAVETQTARCARGHRDGVIHRPRNQRLMQTAAPDRALGKLGKGPRKRRLARKAVQPPPPAEPQPHPNCGIHSPLPSTSRPLDARPRVVGMLSNDGLDRRHAMKVRAATRRARRLAPDRPTWPRESTPSSGTM